MKLRRKITGGRYQKHRKKKLYELPGQKTRAKLDENKKIKSTRSRGGHKKRVLLRGNAINLQNKGKSEKAIIKNVLETPSNKFLARQNVMTKGTVVETDKGKAKITSRPTQQGIINGVKTE